MARTVSSQHLRVAVIRLVSDRTHETADPQANAHIVNGLGADRVLIRSAGPSASMWSVQLVPFGEHRVARFLESLVAVLSDDGP